MINKIIKKIPEKKNTKQFRNLLFRFISTPVGSQWISQFFFDCLLLLENRGIQVIKFKDFESREKCLRVCIEKKIESNIANRNF